MYIPGPVKRSHPFDCLSVNSLNIDLPIDFSEKTFLSNGFPNKSNASSTTLAGTGRESRIVNAKPKKLKSPMDTISYSAFRSQLASTLDKVNGDHRPILITRQNGKTAVVISLEDFQAYEETALLDGPSQKF